MNTDPSDKHPSFEKIIAEKEKRKLAHKRDKTSVWMGFSVFGMVGWSVAVPTIIGAALGIWLDKKYDHDFSWTLSLLVGGLLLGCLIAWNWVQNENKDIQKQNEDAN